MLQNGVEGRFQEYAPNYMKKGEDAQRVTKEVPIETIDKVPVYVFVAEDDIFCPAAQALWTAE